jgi:hypothetical protein
MRKILERLFIPSALVVGLAAAPSLYAHESGGSAMGQGGMMGGQGGMIGMMGQMSEMMESCNNMMQGMTGDHGSQRPNEQWRQNKPGKGENES